MATSKESWSWTKPEGLPGLIGRKQVDWSTFMNGTWVPSAFAGDFGQANGGSSVPPGENRDLVLDIEGREYPARLHNNDRPSANSDQLEIRWDGNSPLRQLLVERFKASYEYLAEVRRAESEAGKRKVFAKTVNPEYMDFYETGVPFRYRVDLVSAVEDTFEDIWLRLRTIIGSGMEVATPARGETYSIHWTADGIDVAADGSPQMIPKASFAGRWDVMVARGFTTVDEHPEGASYRSSAVSAILALLPSVDYAVHPRTTLFLRDHTFRHSDLSTLFGVGTMGGIRYSGRADDARAVVFITSLNSTGDEHPYHDRIEDGVLHYTGEGLSGDQQLSGGNLALSRNVTVDFPIYGFNKVGKDQYRYLGRFRVLQVSQETQSDTAGTPRHVYVFRMKALSTGIIPASPPSPVAPIRDLSAIASDFGSALLDSHIAFGPRHEAVVKAFIASLSTKQLVILTGLSGSGKSQIAIRFGEWLGAGQSAVIPVRPDWTGAEALFGFEDALQPAVGGRQAWHVPETLRFMLTAAGDQGRPYLLVLDEMNLAHVERYFADVLSGMESGHPCLPNLTHEPDGHWRVPVGGPERIRFPRNLFIVGTVNVDETTYMFSPKVLDRANTIEFRVETSDLTPDLRKPIKCRQGTRQLTTGFMSVAVDDDWHIDHPAQSRMDFQSHLRRIHSVLAQEGFEYGHRVFYDAMRFEAMLESAGDANVLHALDCQMMQKILPRLHGTRRRLESTLCELGRFCFNLSISSDQPSSTFGSFDPVTPPTDEPVLPISFGKIRRMTASLRANQFVSFTE